ncbi:MAG: hypothetical protein AMXMBFR33_02000 [Candidatus Xenobia bacterium]
MEQLTPEEIQVDLDMTSFNITVVGRFNRHILEPEWARKRSIISPEPCLAFLPIGGVQPIFRTSSGLCWLLQDDKLLIFGNRSEAPVFLKSVLTELPHTPVTAIGVNFQSSKNVKAKLDVRAKTLSKALEKPLLQASEGRTYQLSDGVKLNLKVTWSAGQRTLDTNFHRDTIDPVVVCKHAQNLDEFEQMAKELEDKL